MIISLQQQQTQRLGSVHVGQDGRQVIPVPSKEEQELGAWFISALDLTLGSHFVVHLCDTWVALCTKTNLGLG